MVIVKYFGVTPLVVWPKVFLVPVILRTPLLGENVRQQPHL